MQAFDPETVLSKLTQQEKIDLLAGIDFWHTKSVPRLGVPSIRLSDGPNGVRGTRFFNGAPAACFPCGTALAATWNMPLLEEAGHLMGEEAIVKGAHVLLGPTVNMQRSPLGGRGFESFSEDPILAGLSAAAIVRGVQSTHVVATIKHFVANDQEHERMAVDAIITQRALREIYLLPFQIAVRDAQPGAFMTSYNKVNGIHVNENPKIMQDILRKEWGWDGLVVSDWYGTYSTVAAMKAGLDLEMPGPSKWRGQLITHSLMAKTLSPVTLDERVRNILNLISRVGQTGVPQNAPEGSRDVPETAALLRKIAGESVVLLKNERNVLPLNKTKTVAVIGPNAKMAAYCGGGSASLLPYYTVTPFDGISSKTGPSNIRYSVGCYSHQMLPLLGPSLRTADGKVGVTFKAFTDPASVSDRVPVDELHLSDTYMYLVDYYHPKLTEDLYWAEVEGWFEPEEDGEYEFGLTVFGTGKLYLDDEMLIDNETVQRSGGSFFNVGTVEETGIKRLEKGKKYRVKVEYASGVTSKLSNEDGVVTFGGGGIRIGGARVINAEEEIENAVKLAKEVDQVVLCVGLNQDWEQEGHDRHHMSLPGLTDRLVSAVATANPNTVVVVQSGTPVSMPWSSQVAGLMHAWYGGNETGNAIADALFGDINPSGKLTLSFPIQVEDNPAFLNYRSERGRVLYGEDVYIGYRFYETTKRAVLFPFGHGLSYTTFSLSNLVAENDGAKLHVALDVENTGSRDGAEVVQVYVSQRAPSVKRPAKELKGFTKVFLKAGEKQRVVVPGIDVRYATSFWDEGRDMWVSEKDTFDVLVGRSSADASLLKGSFEVEKTSWWSGV
ncbi:glycoside hydrolase superfamily [Xylogone sp. PMI_703]|nr:glycoside hydrolase superfamily [Xylogone sp. PMI_703]